MESPSSTQKSHRIPVEAIFAIGILVPSVLTMAGGLFNSDLLRAVGGYASLPTIVLMLGAFTANWVSRSNETFRRELRRKTAERFLLSMEKDAEIEMVILIPDKPEMTIARESGGYVLNGAEKTSREEILELLSAVAKVAVRVKKPTP